MGLITVEMKSSDMYEYAAVESLLIWCLVMFCDVISSGYDRLAFWLFAALTP